ncbi:MAG TPA: TraR/DksA C4-type zinc finger protein [Nevskiaceae bacterium]|nr:TraR/DksA C4-type zinc finger protein [Nevskiaceae bacterium]
MLQRHTPPDPSDIRAVHAALLKKRDELAATLAHIDRSDQARSRDRDWIDITPIKAPERPDVEGVDLRSHTERELRQVQHAIERQDAGLYGLCEVCGGPIDHGRLAAVPEMTHCSRCAAEWPS